MTHRATQDFTHWTYEGYYNALCGPLSAEAVLSHYDIDHTPEDISCWVGSAELQAAWELDRYEDIPAEWSDFQPRLIAELIEAAKGE